MRGNLSDIIGIEPTLSCTASRLVASYYEQFTLACFKADCYIELGYFLRFLLELPKPELA